MQKETIICTFIDTQGNRAIDIEIPLYITCDEFVRSMNEAMKLNMAIPGKSAYFRTQNPITLIKGDKLLSETGIRNGSIIFYERRVEQ